MYPLRQIQEISCDLKQEIKSLLFPDRHRERAGVDFVCFGITDDCILECKMCYKWKKDIFIKSRTKIPTLQHWKNCASSLKEISGSALQINFGGGEPFLDPDILELVRFCKLKGFATNIATNGYLIDEPLARRIADSGLDSIILSLDSLNEETHDYLRGTKGVYQAVMEAIGYLDRFSPHLYKGMCCAIYDQNLDDILPLVDWVDADHRLNSIYFMAAMQPNNTPPDPTWFNKNEFSFLWPRDAEKACAIIDRLIGLKKGGSKITNQVSQLEAFKLYYRCPERFVKNTKCNMDSALHISSCGDIFVCYRWAPLGNIQRDDISEVWRSRETEKVRRDIAACKNNCHFLLNCFFKSDYPFQLK